MNKYKLGQKLLLVLLAPIAIIFSMSILMAMMLQLFYAFCGLPGESNLGYNPFDFDDKF